MNCTHSSSQSPAPRQTTDPRTVVLVRRGPHSSYRRFLMHPSAWDRLIRLLTPPGAISELGAAELILALDGATFHETDAKALADQIRRLLSRLRSRRSRVSNYAHHVVLIANRAGEPAEAAIAYQTLDPAHVLRSGDAERLEALAEFIGVGRFTLRRARRGEAGSVII